MNSPLVTSAASLDERDTRPLAELEFAQDLGDEERNLVIRRQQLEDQLAAARGAIVAENSKKDDEGNEIPPDQKLLAQRTEEADSLIHAIDRLTEKIEPYAAARKRLAEEIRGLLADAEIQTAQDIIEAGCTGLFGKLSSVETVQKIRDNMGGSRVGLPCYVGRDRYCLVHQTIGGLQDGQTARHPNYVAAVSRDLTDHERGYVKTVEHARRRQGQTRMADAQEELRNFSDDGVRRVNEGKSGSIEQIHPTPEGFSGVITPPSPPDMIETFKCQEHGELSWGCRFCVAQAVVEGMLEPEYLVLSPDSTSIMMADRCSGIGVIKRLEMGEEAGVSSLVVYVKAASFTRKLSRDD